MNEPKYDGDSINYGFLKKYLKKYNLDETINSSNKGGTISKVYIVPPNTPYYKGTILIYDNKIYECISDRNIGNFNWNDWKVVAPSDLALNKFIEEIYDVDKLQFQNQLDGKVETFYQADDPSMLWTTDLTKSKHVGDYWYNTVNNTQWRYSKNTSTTPITYSWLQVNIPNSVFDMINTKKSIYTSKPDKYKKNDLWIIEDTISEDDIPISETNPIKKGDWVFAIQDSETYDKSHWIKRDESIDVDYLKDHYYTISDIDTKNNLIKEDYDSKIKKSKEDIYLEVSKSYVKETTYSKQISDYDKKIGTIEDKVETTINDISLIKIDNNKITSSVSSLTGVLFGKKIYELTNDAKYLNEKEYYILNENNEYILLIEGTDYSIGDSINRDVYEESITQSLEDEFNDGLNNLNDSIVQVSKENSNNYQEIQEKFNGYTPVSKTIEIEKSVNKIQTDTYTKTEINAKLTDGSVTKVQTTSGTFDENGMHYQKTGAKTSSTINEKGVSVETTQNNDELLFAGYDELLKESIVRTENLTVRKYFVCGSNSRFEDYTDEEGNVGTGVFDI